MSDDQSKTVFIAPVAIDVGAAHTGVFRAVYKQGESVETISERYGEVLTLKKDDYTLLMRDRTAKRHMRRGFDRRKLARRLLLLVLEHYFDFPARDHAQALGFLLNRRGFTRLEGEYNAEALDDFPQEAWKELPESAKTLLGLPGETGERLRSFIDNQPEKLAELYRLLVEETIQPVKNDLVVVRYVNKLTIAVNNQLQRKTITESQKEKYKLSQTPAWVVEQLKDSGVQAIGANDEIERQVDLAAEVQQLGSTDLEILNSQLESVAADLKQRTATVWKDVRPDRYDAEKNAAELQSDKEKVRTKAHLQNLVYAIAKAHEELSTGSRHRREYFKEIKADIEGASSHPHRYMQDFAAAIEAHDRLDSSRLYQLVAHLSNLELKPLRACFNDKAHREGDQWQPDKLASIVSRWFMKQWRVNAEKDDRATVQRYHNLKERWKEWPQKDDMVAFWLAIDPELTIPPYQSQTNRRPPDCQSLILSSRYINGHYKNWRNWLDQLDASGAPNLSELKSSKGKPLLEGDEQKLRRLQFVLDRAQGSDAHRLNLIWSQYHQYQKGGDKAEQAGKKLDEHLAASALPDDLKKELTPEAFATQGSFGHFLNKYYQSRRKARDGRWFLHPLARKNQGKAKPGDIKPRWDDTNSLLTLCPHRPRQKRHQMVTDFAAIVGMPPKELEAVLSGLALDEFLSQTATLARNAENAAKAQKEHRGALKLKLQRGNDKKLTALANRVEALAIELAARLWPGAGEAEQKEKAKRFNSLHSFAQIHNIVFRDRSGFSNTCPVCSTDNAGRMVEDANGKALASRLPALSIRLIDGAVKRLFEYKSAEIVRRHWPVIEAKLKDGHEVRVPLILEQNRFEFEPSLDKLKGRRGKELASIDTEDGFDEQAKRIRDASSGICPYSGKPLSGSGELDHIIPRKSAYGTLNDEANLIYVSTAENRSRSNQKYYLGNLDGGYKNAQFGTTDDCAIRRWIYQVLTGADAGDDPGFVFGPYLSFRSLTDDQRRAFRHALFLADDDPLKQLVIRAIQNRNRTFVNGTQRYFAQVIADKLHQRARKQGLAGKLSFDYFEYPADPAHPRGTQRLRRALGLEKEQIQEDYSHHIDAHMAFLLAAEDHRNDGSMGVAFKDDESVWPFDDGDIEAYMNTKLQREAVNVLPIGRKASSTGNRPYRSYHRDNFYADRYMPLWLVFSDGEVVLKKGFSPDNSVFYPLSKKKSNTALQCVVRFSSDQWMQSQAEQADGWDDFCVRVGKRFTDAPAYIPWARHVIEQHCIDTCSAETLAKGKIYSEEIEFMRNLAYQTQKKPINTPEDIHEALNIDAKDKGETRKKGLDLPARAEWQRLHEAWVQANQPTDKAFAVFLKEYFLGTGDKSAAETYQPSHKKIRQVFSLPIFNENAHYLQARMDMSGNPVYQLIADSDSRKDGNKFKRAVITPAGDMVEVVNAPFQSKRMFKLKQDKVYAGDDYINIDPNRWHKITDQMAAQWKLDFPEKVRSIAYRIDNVTRPKIRLQFEAGATDDLETLCDILASHPLTRPKEVEKLKKALEYEGVYVGSGFNKEVKSALSTLFQHEKD